MITALGGNQLEPVKGKEEKNKLTTIDEQMKVTGDTTDVILRQEYCRSVRPADELA